MFIIPLGIIEKIPNPKETFVPPKGQISFSGPKNESGAVANFKWNCSIGPPPKKMFHAVAQFEDVLS